MKKILFVATIVMSLVLVSSLALGSPALLPKHLGYPMGEFKDPVSGMPTPNDPGQSVPPPEEAIQSASQFHDAYVVNQVKEYRPNIVHDFIESGEANKTNISQRSDS